MASFIGRHRLADGSLELAGLVLALLTLTGGEQTAVLNIPNCPSSPIPLQTSG